MASNLSEAIKIFEQEKGIPRELVLKTIEEFLFAAYKKKYGTVENAIVKFNDDETDVTMFSKKKIVEDDDFDDDVLEISLKDALAYDAESEIGDELLIEINPKDFERTSVQSAKQRAKQKLREIQKDTLYSEFVEKKGEMIIGYYQREKNGNIYVDLGKTEGMLPKKFQSPRETYRHNDRIKALIYDVERKENGVNIILSRTHTDFVRKLFELEVPELYDKTIEIFNIVREPGYRTKMSVYSHREDVDPVGACVGLKGVRIQSVVKEMEGEKIDVLKYDTDPRVYIKNALSPAEIETVVILDEAKRQALVVVAEPQLSLAIGKQGLNVRLANRLVDWSIDVKTMEQFEGMDISADTKKAVSALFAGESDEESEEITKISELPGIPERLAELLRQHGIELIETFLSFEPEKLLALDGITQQDIESVKSIIDKSVEIIEDSEQNTAEPEDVDSGIESGSDEGSDSEDTVEEVESESETESSDFYECPECGGQITANMPVCPNCGVELSFQEDEEGDKEENS